MLAYNNTGSSLRPQALSVLRLLCLALAALALASSTWAAPTEEAGRAPPADLAWGPVPIGPFTIGMTNPHEGPVPLKYSHQNVMHTNLHVWKLVKNTNKDVINLHIVPEVEGGKRCWYVYESVTRTVVLDDVCDADWPTAFAQMTEGVNNYLQAFFDKNNVSFLERVAIIGAGIFVLGTLVDALAGAAVVVAV